MHNAFLGCLLARVERVGFICFVESHARWRSCDLSSSFVEEQRRGEPARKRERKAMQIVLVCCVAARWLRCSRLS